MANGIGVSNAPRRTGANSRAGGRGGGMFKNPKQRKMLLIFGGVAGLFLFISNKGNAASSSGTDPNAQLQSQSDALAAEEAAMQNPQVPGGGAPVDTGGGSYTTQGPQATTAPAVTVNQPPAIVNVSVPAAAAAKAGTPAVKRRSDKRADARAEARQDRKKPKPKQGSHPKSKPAKSSGKDAGKHPDTHHHTSHGHAKKSPALVESEFGAGSGQVVMGRRFPGAIAHRLGPPRRQTDGSIARTVTVDYGGYTEAHLVHNNGARWTDRAPGMNPPSRGVPVHTSGPTV